MYERIDVWKRKGSGLAVRFQCLRRVADGMFAVQNADYLRPETFKTDVRSSDFRFVELFFEDDPTNRCDWFSSLAEAISSHERDFMDMPGSL